MKKSIYLFLVLISQSFILLGQDQQNRWRIGITYMPGIVYNYETSGEVDFVVQSGLKIAKAVSPQVLIGGGISFYQTNLYHGIMSGEYCPTPTSTCYWCSEQSYLEFPLEIKGYYIPKKSKINPYFQLGFITTFSYKEKKTRVDQFGFGQSYILEDNLIKYQQNYISVAMGTEFYLTRKLELLIEPAFKHSIQALWGKYDFNPTTMMGLNVGLNYKM